MGIDALIVLKAGEGKMPELKKRISRSGGSVRWIHGDTALVNTLMRFNYPEPDPAELSDLVLDMFGKDLAELHDDPRGVLACGDTWEPDEMSYDELVEQAGNGGVWVPLTEEGRQRAMDTPRKTMPAPDFGFGEEGLAGAMAKLGVTNIRISPQLAEVLRSPQMAAMRRMFGGAEEPREPASCALLQPGAWFKGGGRREAHRLADGSLVVVSVTPHVEPQQAFLPSVTLDEELSWCPGQRDARGVLVFSEENLDEVLEASSYDDAVARIGRQGSWIPPQRLSESAADKLKALEKKAEAALRRAAPAKRKPAGKPAKKKKPAPKKKR